MIRKTGINRHGSNQTFGLMVQSTGEYAKIGDVFKTSKGEKVELLDAFPPHKSTSTGRVCVRDVVTLIKREFYPHVVDCQWLLEA